MAKRMMLGAIGGARLPRAATAAGSPAGSAIEEIGAADILVPLAFHPSPPSKLTLAI